MLPETSSYITISQGNKTYSNRPLHYINQVRIDNVYTLTIKKRANKRVKFGNIMSVIKTSVQIAVAEGIAGELTGLLTQFIMKYRRSTGLNIGKIQEVFSYDVTKNNCQQ